MSGTIPRSSPTQGSTENLVFDFLTLACDAILQERRAITNPIAKSSELYADNADFCRRSLQAWRRDLTKPLVLDLYIFNPQSNRHVLMERWKICYVRLREDKRDKTPFLIVQRRVLTLIRSLYCYVRLLPGFNLINLSRRVPTLSFQLYELNPQRGYMSQFDDHDEMVSKYQFNQISTSKGYIALSVRSIGASAVKDVLRCVNGGSAVMPIPPPAPAAATNTQDVHNSFTSGTAGRSISPPGHGRSAAAGTAAGRGGGKRDSSAGTPAIPIPGYTPSDRDRNDDRFRPSSASSNQQQHTGGKSSSLPSGGAATLPPTHQQQQYQQQPLPQPPPSMQSGMPSMPDGYQRQQSRSLESYAETGAVGGDLNLLRNFQGPFSHHHSSAYGDSSSRGGARDGAGSGGGGADGGGDASSDHNSRRKSYSSDGGGFADLPHRRATVYDGSSPHQSQSGAGGIAAAPPNMPRIQQQQYPPPYGSYGSNGSYGSYGSHGSHGSRGSHGSQQSASPPFSISQWQQGNIPQQKPTFFPPSSPPQLHQQQQALAHQEGSRGEISDGGGVGGACEIGRGSSNSGASVREWREGGRAGGVTNPDKASPPFAPFSASLTSTSPHITSAMQMQAQMMQQTLIDQRNQNYGYAGQGGQGGQGQSSSIAMCGGGGVSAPYGGTQQKVVRGGRSLSGGAASLNTMLGGYMPGGSVGDGAVAGSMGSMGSNGSAGSGGSRSRKDSSTPFVYPSAAATDAATAGSVGTEGVELKLRIAPLPNSPFVAQAGAGVARRRRGSKKHLSWTTGNSSDLSAAVGIGSNRLDSVQLLHEQYQRRDSGEDSLSVTSLNRLSEDGPYRLSEENDDGTTPQNGSTGGGGSRRGSCNSGIGDDDHDNDDDGGADCECQYSLDGITVAEGDEEEPEEADEDDDDEMPFAWAAPDRGGFIHATGSDSAAANAAHSTAASAALDALSSQSGRLSTLSSQQVQLPPQLMGLSSFKSTTSGTSAAATPSTAASGAGVGAGAMGAYSLDQGSQFGAASDGSGGSATQVLSNELQSRIDQFKNLHVSFTQH